MKNLRKLLAVILTVAFMATFSIPAFAAVPSDVVGTAYEDAVARLVALGIIKGRPDGSYAPNDSVTRAEFATIIIRALGLESSAGVAKSQVKFSDVASSHWAAGYVNLAASLGIIKGRPDGTFGPDDTVLYEEAVTMIVRALGYEPAVATKGGYPGGYLIIADENDITDGFNGVVGLAANRGLVAQLINKALEVPMMIQVGYGSDTRYVVSGAKGTDTDEVKLIDKIGLGTVEGKVASVDTDKGKIDIKEIKESGGFGSTKKYKVYEGIKLDGSLENLYVKVWTKDDVIYNIDIETDVYYDFIKKIDGEDDTDYIDDDLADIKEIEIKAGDEFDVNNGDFVEDNTTFLVGGGTPSSSDDLLNTFAKIYVKDDVAYRIEAYNFGSNKGLITSVSESEIEFVKGASEGRKIRDLDKADSLLVVIDGEVASLEDLEPNMYFGYYVNGSDYVIVAVSDTIEGTLDAAKDTKISIDGTYTDLANPFYVSKDEGENYDEGSDSDSFSALLDIDIIAHLDFDGKIAYVCGAGDTEETTSFYGVVQKAWESDEMYLKVYREVDGEGKSVTYKVEDNDDTTLFSSAIDNVTATDPVGGTEGTVNGVYKFTINEDGVITKIETITWETDGSGNGAANVFENITDFDADNDKIEVNDTTSGADAGEDTFRVGSSVIFNLVDKDDAFSPSLVKWADIENKDSFTGVKIMIEQNNQGKPGVVVFVDGYEALDVTGTKVGLLVDKARKNSDDFNVKVDTGDEDGVAFVVDEDEDQDAKENNLIIYKEVGGSRIEIDTAYDIIDGLTSVDEVYDVDGDSIQFAEGGTWYEIANNCLIYEITLDNGALDTIERSDVDGIDDKKDNDIGDEVYYYAEGNIVKAIFYVRN